ncbi:4-(cytidine 5'-diphospho)-2-C-methyl-D-erythritol kinase [Paragemmobacter straminiformis]|uniref:4-diphosphocytidyl-2-C-methyl-D-erythritol kinase n=1 Tax=Paragemmobacter straminiformis TaxID=2045119 RepID=A0A842I5T0_9RHOB|nr:4-(cytidine 5'-diphospho)-2-C-methyl-D-erythritol kinase [Gemmobacter straminiformis]MBC2834727.1 4-(cytidine 5'-diphospho)-2-C-methyl-D-erythritol kinase [Gemmobacter straminiformis]
MATEFAPAKINLALHVTGQRADGYHLLDSLVVFADTGDRITAKAAPDLTLSITGPRAASLPATDDNLVLRAARAIGVTAAITLDKHLPIASGIGGGSSDAAATLRALARLSGKAMPDAAAILSLGADVPVCLAPRPVRMTGIGETLAPLAHALPPSWLVLVNPGVAVSTPQVFKALARRDNAGLKPLPKLANTAEFAAWLAMQRNDLEAPAQGLLPEIAAMKSALTAQQGCLLARMSGSGATCFGLFADPLSAHAAATAIRHAQPLWWVADAAVMA